MISIKQKTISDEVQAANFKSMLRSFEGVVKDETDSQEAKKAKLLKICETALTKNLNGRQLDAVHGRCHNYINGEYAVDAKKADYMKTNP